MTPGSRCSWPDGLAVLDVEGLIVATVDDADLKLAVGYLKNLARQFDDIPKGAAPMFYHTLTEAGDIAEGERLRGLIARLNGTPEAQGSERHGRMAKH